MTMGHTPSKRMGPHFVSSALTIWLTVHFIITITKMANCESFRELTYNKVRNSSLGMYYVGSILDSSTVLLCAHICSLSTVCQSFLWDPILRTCTTGYAVSNGNTFPTGSQMFFTSPNKCRYDLDYQLRARGDVVRCVYASYERKTYASAKQDCQQRHGRLIKANSIDLLTLIMDILDERGGPNEDSFYIGLDDIVLEGTFVWSDGQAMTSEEYTLFNDGEPSADNNEDCGQSRKEKHGLLNDKSCDTSIKFVCEMDF